jgi:diacylglycerol kinase family enzyme
LVAEDAQIDDGLLHLFAISTKNPFRLALILLQVTRGRQGRSKWVHTMVAPAFEVTTVRPMAVRADGKIITETPALFRVRSSALSVFAPAKT